MSRVQHKQNKKLTVTRHRAETRAPCLFSALCSLMKIRDHQYLVLLGIDAQLKSILSSADIEE